MKVIVKRARHQHTVRVTLTVSVDSRDPHSLEQLGRAIAAFARHGLTEEQRQQLIESLEAERRQL